MEDQAGFQGYCHPRFSGCHRSKKNTTDLDPLITIRWGFLKDLGQPSPLPVALGSTYIENTVLFGRKEILIKESRRKKKKKNALSKFFNYKLGDV